MVIEGRSSLGLGKRATTTACRGACECTADQPAKLLSRLLGAMKGMVARDVARIANGRLCQGADEHDAKVGLPVGMSTVGGGADIVGGPWNVRM